MKLKLILTISAIFLINSLFAQSPRFIIEGVVRDATNGETLPFANVFLTGTTYGTTTNEEGEYSLKVFEPGRYELIVRFIGFNTYVKAIEFLSPQTLNIDVSLNAETTNLGSVEVTDQLDKEWKRNLSAFKREFLGYSKNAQRSKILNEEKINFYYDKKNKTLQAFCDEPIKVENRALGYRLDYYLEEFLIDYNIGFTRYYGYTQFSDSKEGNSKKRRYKKSRELAYKGSREHFFKALYRGELAEEGYEVMIAKDIGQLGRAITASKVNLYDSLMPGVNEISKSLKFKDYIYVTYLREFESVEYTGTADLKIDGVDGRPKPQKSWMSLIDEETPIFFQENGYLINPVSFFSNGYWGFEKVADMLPTNYIPERN